MRAKGNGVWKDYPGKKALGRVPANFEWRLLNKDKTKVIWPRKKKYASYKNVLANMRRIEFFKHRKSYGSKYGIYKRYQTGKQGGQIYWQNSPPKWRSRIPLAVAYGRNKPLWMVRRYDGENPPIWVTGFMRKEK